MLVRGLRNRQAEVATVLCLPTLRLAVVESADTGCVHDLLDGAVDGCMKLHCVEELSLSWIGDFIVRSFSWLISCLHGSDS